jgi:hypothetical protein
MITFPVEDTFPLSDGNFHNKKSIISEHYGFTDALIEDVVNSPELRPYQKEALKKLSMSGKYGTFGHVHSVDAIHEYCRQDVKNTMKIHESLPKIKPDVEANPMIEHVMNILIDAEKNAAHVAFENFINQPLTTELDLDYE